jgi:phosphoheptose isomerase
VGKLSLLAMEVVLPMPNTFQLDSPHVSSLIGHPSLLLSWTINSTINAIGNDYGFEQVVARELSAIAIP